jgi:BirA family biotin operon repressor/biotin-[acetyl-CoA-carboxylase] ligase
MNVDPLDSVLIRLYEAGAVGMGRDALRALAKAEGLDVEKALALLAQRGMRVVSMPEGSYRLAHPIKLDAALIERGLGTERIGQSVICFQSVASTNDVAWDSARQGNTDGLVIAAESQKSGRGRFGRTWVSPEGKNLLFSVVLHDPENKLAQEALTISAGLAVAEGVEQVTGVGCDLKWPNDVLIDRAKLAGVLVETGRIQRKRWWVVGMGINVGSAPSPDRIAARGACLDEQCSRPCDRIAVLRQVLRRLEHWIQRIESRSLEQLRLAWLGRCGMLHERIRARQGDREYEGTVLDIHPLEGLILGPDRGPRVLLASSNTTILD